MLEWRCDLRVAGEKMGVDRTMGQAMVWSLYRDALRNTSNSKALTMHCSYKALVWSRWRKCFKTEEGAWGGRQLR